MSSMAHEDAGRHRHIAEHIALVEAAEHPAEFCARGSDGITGLYSDLF
jgi:hypothetical protein